MNSFLIVSKSKSKGKKYANDFLNAKNIAAVDITFFDKGEIKANEGKKTTPSIGVEDVKVIKGKLYLKPIKSLQKALVIIDSHLLTHEAQNALLKILEEPPNNTIIILIIESQELLLPTILSRCQVIDLKNENIITQDEIDKLEAQLLILQTADSKIGLTQAETLAKNKEESIIWLEKMIFLLREKMLDSIEKGSTEEIKWYTKTLAEFQKSNKILKMTNINIRMTLENLFLSLSSVS